MLPCTHMGAICRPLYTESPRWSILPCDLTAATPPPPHTIKNLPIGEYIRATKSCSTDSSLKKEMNIIDGRLKQQGYSSNLLNRAKNIAKSKTRVQYLFATKHSDNTQNKFVFSTPYSQHFEKL